MTMNIEYLGEDNYEFRQGRKHLARAWIAPDGQGWETEDEELAIWLFKLGPSEVEMILAQVSKHGGVRRPDLRWR
jgi:hypothetical protein